MSLYNLPVLLLYHPTEFDLTPLKNRNSSFANISYYRKIRIVMYFLFVSYLYICLVFPPNNFNIKRLYFDTSV